MLVGRAPLGTLPHATSGSFSKWPAYFRFYRYSNEGTVIVRGLNSLITRHRETLRPLSEFEQDVLGDLSRSQSEPEIVVIHARLLLSVAGGLPFVRAARKVGGRSAQTVACVVRRFNEVGLESVYRKPGSGRVATYSAADRKAIVSLARSTPDRERDGTATWSISTLCRSLRRNGFPNICNSSVWFTLKEAGLSWQNTRTWCDTGIATRKRKSGTVQVVDPDAELKKTHYPSLPSS